MAQNQTEPAAPPTLAEIADTIQDNLARGALDRRSPWRWATLGTIDVDKPQMRTVVLRRFERDSFTCHFYTDSRTPKVAQLLDNPAASLLFFDPGHMVQVRLGGRAVLDRTEAGTLPDDMKALWDTLPTPAKGDYLSKQPPGSAQQDSGDADTALTEPDNFLPHSSYDDRIDWLKLSRSGHQRAAFSVKGGAPDGQFLVP